MRLLVTGASGFVGTHLQSLISASPAMFANVDLVLYDRYQHLDLFDKSAPLQIIEAIEPTHVLHLAWASTTGKNYDKSDENHKWMHLTCSLVEKFASAGIINWVVGTGLETLNSSDEALSPYGVAKLESKKKILGMKSSNARWISMPYLFSLHHDRPRILAAAKTGENLKYPLEQHDYLEIRDCVYQLGTKIVTDSTRQLSITRGQMHSNQTLVDRALALQSTEVATSCSCSTKSLNSESLSPFYFTDKVLHS